MKDLLVENAKIIEKSKTRVLLEYEQNGKTKQKVYKYAGQKNIGDFVNLYTITKESIFHMLFLFIPVFCLILGLCVGFAFSNKVFQYVLTLCLGTISFLIVAYFEKKYYKNLLSKVICE
ncbi:MAG: SoxR reducing system RseC family protein [Clostridia bacterium]|nr:SoxR reducing system RseC family protein [Clostridia bacterium]